MKTYPWAIQNALDNRVVLGKEAVETYWKSWMTPRQRNSVDIWIMQNRKDIMARCKHGTQLWRFCHLIEALYGEQQRKKARKKGRKKARKVVAEQAKGKAKRPAAKTNNSAS